MQEDYTIDEQNDAYAYLPEEYDPRKQVNPQQVQEAAQGEAGGNQPSPAPKPPVAAFDREKFKNDWVSQNAHTGADMDAFLQSHPEYAQSVKRQGKDIWAINDPRGTEYVDALFDESGGQSHAQWTDPGMNGGGGGAPGAGVYGGESSRYPAGAGGQGVYGTGNKEMDDAMHSALLAMLKRNSGPIDVNAQFGPVDAIFQRNAMESRNAAAERAAFQGSNIGGAGGPLDAEQNKISEGLAQKEGGLMAELMRDEMNARRQDVMNALQFAQGEEKIALQKQLADMDNEIQRMGLSQRDRQFNAQLGENQRQFDEGMDNSDAWKEYMYSQYFDQALQ